MNNYKHLLTLVFLVVYHCVLAQDGDLIETGNGGQIRQGLFVTFEDFKRNDPVSEESIVTSYPRDGNFYYNLLKEDINIKSTDHSDSIMTSIIWGYFDGKGLYLNVKKFPSFLLEGKDVSAHSWAQIIEIGKICMIHYNENFNPETGTITPEVGTNGTALFLMNSRDGTVHEANAGNFATLIRDDPRVLSAFNNHNGDNEGRLNTFLKIYNERHKLELP
ncbi:MAG TPA: hypothetical protein VK666_30330 [Chryseolinea sp.]|nr:hypothetical protein [Chryseolinea sp.]